jgi:hypothetical protein
VSILPLKLLPSLEMGAVLYIHVKHITLAPSIIDLTTGTEASEFPTHLWTDTIVLSPTPHNIGFISKLSLEGDGRCCAYHQLRKVVKGT